MHPVGIYPVPNKWGEKGATTFELGSKLPKEIIMEALLSAYTDVVKQERKKKKNNLRNKKQG
jgi:hypothetical protein